MSHFGSIASLPVRTYDEERSYLEQVGPCEWRIKPGFVPGMNVPGTFYVNPALQEVFSRCPPRHAHAHAQRQRRACTGHTHTH
jgi:hypothetical protein